MRAVRGMILVLLGIVGCGANGAEAGDDPTGVVWRWRSQSGAEALEIDRPGRYTLELRADGRYFARADCNQANGAYTLENGRLRLGPAATTLVECGPGSHSTRFLGLLGKPAVARREGDRLTLTLEDGSGALELQAAPEVTLAGSSWVVRAVNNGRQAVVSVAIGTSLDARFDADGNVTGSAGCNRYNARYQVEGDALSIGPAAATRRMCAEPERIMEQEAAFLAALGTVARYAIRGERLQLRTGEGALAIDLVSAVAGSLSIPGSGVLPPEARVRVLLEDVSLADAPARVIGEEVFTARGQQAPLLFHVVFDPADIDPRHRYAIRAVVEDASGQVLFRTTEAFPVLTHDSPTLGVEVLLDPVS